MTLACRRFFFSYILCWMYAEFLNAFEVKIENVSLFCFYKFFILLKCEICRAKPEETEKRKTIDLKENVWQLQIFIKLWDCERKENVGIIELFILTRFSFKEAICNVSRKKVLTYFDKFSLPFHSKESLSPGGGVKEKQWRLLLIDSFIVTLKREN